jgi:hypothetical protein
LPVFHSKHLEDGNECNPEVVVVTSGVEFGNWIVESSTEQTHS